MNGHCELKLDALGNIQPTELGFKHMCQATVELVSCTDDVTMWIGLRNQRDEYTVQVSST